MLISYNKLWKILIDRNMSRTQLVDKAKISTNAMAKMGKNQEVRMETLIKICGVLECKIDDIMDYTTQGEIL
jgi:DNA (cytosine-5)-methyltransferase 1